MIFSFPLSPILSVFTDLFRRYQCRICLSYLFFILKRMIKFSPKLLQPELLPNLSKIALLFLRLFQKKRRDRPFLI